jgi:HAD superfamily hydrolase (TIGR01509 family)
MFNNSQMSQEENRNPSTSLDITAVDLNQPHTIYKPALSHTLLDCDDTLLKTEAIALRECYEVLKDAIDEHSQGKLSFPATKEEFVHNHTGGAFRDMLSQFLEKNDPNFSSQSDTGKAFIEKFSAKEQEKILEKFKSVGIEPTLGTEKFLNAHQSRGLTPVIVSSSSDARLEVSVASSQLADHFETKRIFSAQNSAFMEEGGRRKPAPDVYLHAMEKMGITSNEAIAVEDSASGIKAALRAGLDTVVFVGANKVLPSTQETQIFIKEIYDSISESRPLDETNPLGRIIAVTNDSEALIPLVDKIRTGESFFPWQVTSVNNGQDVDLSKEFF